MKISGKLKSVRKIYIIFNNIRNFASKSFISLIFSKYKSLSKKSLILTYLPWLSFKVILNSRSTESKFSAESDLQSNSECEFEIELSALT